MSSLTYEAIAFLQDSSDFDLAAAARRLAEWLPEWQVVRRGKDISVRSPGYALLLRLADEPLVAEESLDMAAFFANCPRANEIAEGKRRIDVSCADPDPGMDHFNDFICVCQALESFRGVILLDPRSGELI